MTKIPIRITVDWQNMTYTFLSMVIAFDFLIVDGYNAKKDNWQKNIIKL